MPKHLLITTPIYYVNDLPHIGSAYPTLLADVIARQKRKEGYRVHFSTGTDEHGVKNLQSAKNARKEVKEFVDEMAQGFKATWERLNISFDDFIRTTEPRHETAVIHFIEKLKNSGHIYQGTYKGLYCVGCEMFKEESELTDGVCPIHQQNAEYVEEKNWFFRVSAFTDTLKGLIESDAIAIEPAGKKAETLGLLKLWTDDVSISREHLSWGIPLPFDKEQTIYVWVDALINYLTTVGYPDERYKKFWPHVLHIIGKDILKHHAVIWPALLLAIGLESPKRIFAHSFFTVEGQKMSKSLGNVITPDELIKEFGVDGARYVLLAEISGDTDSDISWDKFQTRYNADLKHNIGNIFSRLVVLAQKNDIKDLRVTSYELRIKKRQGRFKEHIEKIKVAEAIKEAQAIFEEINKYLDEAKPWKETDQSKIKEVLQRSFSTFLGCINLLEPIIPQTAKQVLALKKDDRLVVPKENIHLFS